MTAHQRMDLQVAALALPEVKIIRPKKNVDSRGFFSETYNRQQFSAAGIDLDFVQDNHSLSREAGTLRGLHYQAPPFAQDKLVRVVAGRIFDVAVDLRRSSPSFGKWVSAVISAEDWNQIFVPVGFAHGFCTLTPNTEVIYKVTAYFSKEHDLGIRWNDPDLGIGWPVPEAQIRLSEKDAAQPFFREAATFF
jgi:dTDP-4-dehydrorhamnose 3,5-epimerase